MTSLAVMCQHPTAAEFFIVKVSVQQRRANKRCTSTHVAQTLSVRGQQFNADLIVHCVC